jgi:hypothetical protein
MSFITDAIGGLFGTKQQADASSLASRQQADSQANAQAQLQANLAPYANFGSYAMPNIMQQLGLGGGGSSLNLGNVDLGNFNYGNFKYDPFSFDPSNLQNTPGYQFTLNQGLKNTNNALSNQGLLGSGAQGKALAEYTTGLASNTYNQQLNNALNAYKTNYDTGLGQYNANYNTGIGSFNANSSNALNQLNANNTAKLNQFNANLDPLFKLLNLGQNSAAGIGQGAYNSSVNAGNAIAQGTIGSGQQATNTFNALSGAGKTGASIYELLSDIRAKENIEFRGYTPKGHKVYEFEYKPQFKDQAGHGRFVGVMAQEVEKTMPEAVITRYDGYKTVNYELVG